MPTSRRHEEFADVTNGHVDAGTSIELPQTERGVIRPTRKQDRLKRQRRIHRPRLLKRGRPRKTAIRKQSKRRRLYMILIIATLAAGTVAFVRTIGLTIRMNDSVQNLNRADTNLESQIKDLNASIAFPLPDATAKARRLAYECFTVPNSGSGSVDSDPVAVQNKALADAGIPVGSKVNCGWNGEGRGKVDDMQVVQDSYWIHDNRATIILQIKLYQRSGFFYYYVPFTNKGNGVAEFAGMPAIFGTASGAKDFMTNCADSAETIDVGPLQHTADLFLRALANDQSIDLGYLTYNGAQYGQFGPTVSSPYISQLKYCGTKGNEKLFATMVQFDGPVAGSHYTLPYGFGVVPNPQANDKFQVKDFGPAPGYTGD